MGKILKLCVLHTNDTHSYLDDYGKRAALIKNLRAQNEKDGISTLLLGGGDAVSGDVYFNMYHGAKEAELLALLGYDAITFGNHEFDSGSKMLAEYLQALTVPLVTSNVDLSQDPILREFVTNGRVVPYLLKEVVSDVKVGIFGLTTETTVDTGAPSPMVHFAEHKEVAEQMITKLHELEATVIICISHLGDDVDRRFAHEVSGISVIVGAHTHVVMEEALIIGSTAIVQAGYYGKYLGELQLEIDLTSGKLCAVQENLHKIADETATDPQIQQIIAQLQADKVRFTSEVIAETKDSLNGDKEVLNRHETALGNLVADAYFAQAEQDGFAPDLAIINSGGIRTGLPQGTVTRGDLLKILPFSKQLMLLEVTGEELATALEYGLFPQVSHARLSYDLAQKEGSRLLDIEIGGEKLDPLRKYLVATNNFVGIGKDFFRGFEQAKVIADELELDVDILANYLRSLPQPLTYSGTKRVTY